MILKTKEILSGGLGMPHLCYITIAIVRVFKFDFPHMLSNFPVKPINLLIL